MSLDLDNKWSYLKTHGDAGWEEFPSYLDIVTSRMLDFLQKRRMKITVFVVGQDAALKKNHAALSAIAGAGHEIGNHSFHHEPWLHRYSGEQVIGEIRTAEEHIEAVCGQIPRGFRGPGYSLSPAVLKTLIDRGYQYDASTLPTFIGPLARAYYFFTARLTAEQKEERGRIFGSIRDGLRPLKPYWWRTEDQRLLEIPVTTMPLFRTPFHVSYLLYLSQYSRRLASWYYRTALALCRARSVEPSLLLHPLDFLGAEDDSDLSFFPAMKLAVAQKLDLLEEVIEQLSRGRELVCMSEHARRAAEGLSRFKSVESLAPAPENLESSAT